MILPLPLERQHLPMPKGNSQSTGTSFLLSADGSTLITERERILERWAEHFKFMLNRQSIINNEAIHCLDQMDTNHKIESPPEKMKSRKS